MQSYEAYFGGGTGFCLWTFVYELLPMEKSNHKALGQRLVNDRRLQKNMQRCCEQTVIRIEPEIEAREILGAALA